MRKMGAGPGGHVPKIYDCFTFFNELDLLEVRLAEHNSAVDFFVLVEATVTFQGNPKPLYYGENRARFAHYAHKIRHIVVDKMPKLALSWDRERFQRECMRSGFEDAAPTDTIVISDVDEIFRASALREAAARTNLTFLSQSMHYYFMDWLAVGEPWAKAFCAPRSFVDDMPDIGAPRWDTAAFAASHGFDLAEITLLNAGWHFTWMGGVEKMMLKLDAFSHVEPEVQRYRDPAALADAINRKQWFMNGRELRQVPVDDSFPKRIRDHQNVHRILRMLAPRPVGKPGASNTGVDDIGDRDKITLA